ncbi:MAG: helix-turn-helix domain-containing protein [Oscillospiraceae bacterium]
MEKENKPFDGLLSFGEARMLYGLSESTLRKAVVYGKLKENIDCKKFGKQWVVTKLAMEREYGKVKNQSKSEI